MRRLLLLSAVPLLLIGCSRTPAPPADPAPSEPATAAATPAPTPAAAYPTDPRPHMKHHFADACVLHDAVVRGDLDAMRDAAGRLATHEAAPDADGFAPELVQSMRSYAADAQKAQTLGPAVFAAGKLGVTCGECHSKAEATVSFASVAKPPGDDEDIRGHMTRHAWAANRMWEGLVAGDTARWAQGVNELAEPPLPMTVFGTDAPETASKASEMVHELGATGLTATDQVARGKVYTQLLSACSQCHTALGRGPGTGVYSGQ